MPRFAVTLFAGAGVVLGVAGCECGRARPVDAGLDAPIAADGAVDAGGDDAGSDAGPMIDAGPIDAGPIDAAIDGGAIDAGSGDAGPRDAGTDAAVTDAGSDAGSGCADCITYQCAPAIAGNETMSGLVLSSGFSPGMRFQVPAGPDRILRRVEVNVQPGDPSASTMFAAITQLASETDAPDTGDFTGADTVGVMMVPLPPSSGSSITVSVDGSLRLAPGWYALALGAGAHGATVTGATIHSNGGDRCTDGRYPFSVRRSDAMLILQAASPHFLVELEAVP